MHYPYTHTFYRAPGRRRPSAPRPGKEAVAVTFFFHRVAFPRAIQGGMLGACSDGVARVNLGSCMPNAGTNTIHLYLPHAQGKYRCILNLESSGYTCTNLEVIRLYVN
jgi:hypothetical protein